MKQTELNNNFYQKYSLNKPTERFVKTVWAINNSSGRTFDKKIILPNGCFYLAIVTGLGADVFIENLEKYAKFKGLDYLNECGLISHPRILDLIRRRLEIEHDASFIRIRIEKGNACVAGERPQQGRFITTGIRPRRFDLDDVRTEIGEELSTIRRRRRRQVEYA